MMKAGRSALIFGMLAGSLVVAGCAGPEALSSVSAPDRDRIVAREQLLRGIDPWRASGRVVLKTSEGREAADFSWETHGETYAVKLLGPFGRQAVAVEQLTEQARYQQGRDKALYGERAQDLLLWETGWDIPLTQLRQWMIGLPGARAESLRYDSLGRLVGFEVAPAERGAGAGDRWSVGIAAYQATRWGDLPSVVTARAVGGDAGIDVSIRRWSRPSEGLESLPGDSDQGAQNPVPGRLIIPGAE